MVSQYHITAQQINKLKKGEQVGLVSLDRNLCDYFGSLEKVYKKKGPFKPRDVLCEGNHYHFNYTHEKGLHGYRQFTGFKDENEKFEFDVEYKKDYWYPLENGKLKKTKHPNNTEEFFIKSNVRVGWRGPMIFEKDLKKLPDIYL